MIRSINYPILREQKMTLLFTLKTYGISSAPVVCPEVMMSISPTCFITPV